MKKITLLSIISAALFFIWPGAGTLFAEIIGECSNCHTMHNSQGGLPMATYGATGQPWTGTGPYPLLTRGDCLGCHGMGTANNIEIINGCDIPQVFHQDSSDLAGGNFAYITGFKGGGASDAKGHNVLALDNPDATLTTPPGGHGPSISIFRCAGSGGCHGYRNNETGLESLQGAHHRNVDGKCDIADEVYNSYRFLKYTKGLENTVDKWQNVDQNSHNEYFGETTPALTDMDTCTSCHDMANEILSPPSSTISSFCASCHGNFHSVEGIGGDNVSPFTRHPTDIVLKGSGEYASYTVYNVQAPIARQTVPDVPGNVVTPGTDVVTCLSCHAAHATDYPDMLRWDYNGMIAGGGGDVGQGCFVCHTTKDD